MYVSYSFILTFARQPKPKLYAITQQQLQEIHPSVCLHVTRWYFVDRTKFGTIKFAIAMIADELKFSKRSRPEFLRDSHLESSLNGSL